MITPWEVYWITRLDGLHGLCVALAIACPVAAFCCLAVGDIAHDSICYYQKKIYGLLAAMLFFIILSVVVPTTNTAAAIYLIPKIANNEQVQKLPDNAMKFLNGKLERWIADMGEKKEKGK